MEEKSALATALTEYAEAHPLPDTATQTMFRTLLPDALVKATRRQPDGTYFVATGDIPAMWLRDATFQVLPYVQLIKDIPDLKPILEGVLRRELAFVRLDPYANAFNETTSGAHWRADDESDRPMSPQVWERKFEIDTLCAPLLLAVNLYAETGDASIFDIDFWATFTLILTIFEQEQHHERSPYFFRRSDADENDTLPNNGLGNPIGETGLIWDGFRPSDNRCEYGFHIPANLLAKTVLTHLLPLMPVDERLLAKRTQTLVAAIEQGVMTYAIQTLPSGEQGLAYEVDGLGHARLMDDANVPSLLSLPFLGAIAADDPLYLATKAFVLSPQNPYYYEGKMLTGIGSEHTPPEYVWPIAVAMEGLVATTAADKMAKLLLLVATTGGTGQCHEGVQKDDPLQYTRTWFSWANMTFCQLALDVIQQQEQEGLR
ncbi:glycoside hydrolase family 125 protein [Lacticaseibacillus parahuelsenbergensis]|uniref:Glycoside hydrolase family 125 protein n=1 Tax=Lacticaseibacillus parahuelsenbergensis TaxID=3068305 RepID=A0ABY9L2C6_9LACO|nr:MULTISPECIES: glycoside hydrolase family 125 protein [Lacticaseibacillus]MDE3283648.1 glycoside hydrolase family 125 protein [Lacticaseibacillus casei]WLV77762.1 glycoside hydrolase family 125 protein [Lacticaseibacillus sp. NCIMB 15471]